VATARRRPVAVVDAVSDANCRCPELYAGTHATGVRNLSSACPEHGRGTEFWAESTRRAGERTRELWAEVHAARARARDAATTPTRSVDDARPAGDSDAIQHSPAGRSRDHPRHGNVR